MKTNKKNRVAKTVIGFSTFFLCYEEVLRDLNTH